MNGALVIKKVTTFASFSSAFLRRMWIPVWKILTFNLADDRIAPLKNVSASIESGTLSVAYGSRFLSRIKMGGFREYSFEEKYPTPDNSASSIALAINDLKISKAQISLGIPKEWTIIKIAELPITVKENLPEVISYELDRFTPFSSEDALYDFKILKESTEKLTVLILATKADIVKPYIDSLSEKGIDVSKVILNLSGIEALCRYIDRKTESIFLEIGESRYEGASFMDGSITQAFTGSFTTHDEQSRVNTMVEELSSVIESFKKQGKIPQLILLLKDKNSRIKELMKLQSNLPLKILNESDIRIRHSDRGQGIPYRAVGGVVESLWPKLDGMNLLARGHHKRVKTPKVFTLVLLLVIVSIWVLYLIAPLRVEEKRLAEIDRQILMRKEDVIKTEELKKDINTLETEITSINSFKGNSPLRLDVIKELTTILPKSAWLTRVRIRESTLNIEGYASSATALLSKLEASKIFKKVEYSSPTIRDNRMNAERFNIKMEIEAIRKEEISSKKKEDMKGEEE